MVKKTNMALSRKRAPTTTPAPAGRPQSPLPPQKIRLLLLRMNRLYKEAECSLRFGSPLELLVATILSAQCTDKRVNKVTQNLFRKYRTLQDYATAPAAVLQEDIRSTGFYRNKAKSINNACARIVDKYSSQVPSTMAELLTLPGVGRKTANVILGNAYGKTEGIAVDTHVSRLAERLGLSPKKAVDKIEADLMQIVPKKRWTLFSHQMIQHGRNVCTARKPNCSSCPFADFCPSS